MNQPLSFVAEAAPLSNRGITDCFSSLMHPWQLARGPKMRVNHATTILAILLMCLPSAVASSSELSFLGVTSHPEADGSRAVAIDPSGDYLAVGYNDHTLIMWLENETLIHSIDVSRPVETLEFSNNGALLAIALSGSETEGDAIQLFNMNLMEMTTLQSTANAFPKDIAWSPDDALLAIPNSNNGVDLIRTSTMELERSLSGGHNTDVSCIDFTSNGGHILTGDVSGRLLMWNADGTETSKQWELNSEVSSCGFDPTDTRVASLTVNGQLDTMSFAGGSLQTSSFSSGSSLSWSSNGAYLHFIDDASPPALTSVDSSTFAIVETTHMAHLSTDMAYVENDAGLMHKVYTTTDTQHVASYGHHSNPDGYGLAGADLDGDQIPDVYDDDDDGDAISDTWDNYCQVEGDDCTRIPDEDKIRTVFIRFNETHLVIKDQIYLDIVLSSSIRNMSRISVINDLQLSQSEADLFASAVCGNVAKGVLLAQWDDVITLSEGQLLDGVVSCTVTDGMTLTAQNDYKSHIGFEFQITFNLSSPPSFPHSITLSEQPIATDASLAHLVEMHPIALTVEEKGAQSISWSPWWVVDGELELTLEAKAEEKQPLPMTVLGLLLDYPILFLPIFALIGLLAVGALRTKNSMGMDLDIFDDAADVHEVDLRSAKEKDELTSEAESVQSEEPTEDRPKKSPPTRKKPAEKPQQDHDSDEVTQRPVTRRRTATVKQSREGPITTVKRKRLDDRSVVEQTPKKKATRKKVVTQTSVRKTRRVVTGADKEAEDSPGET